MSRADPTRRADLEALPALLAEIAEVAGLDAALAIARVKGGQEVFVPARLSDQHWLVEAVGRARAEIIADHFTSGRGRIKLDIPLGPAGSYLAERRRRARLLADAIAEGASANQAAQRAGLTRRSVLRAKARQRARSGGDQGSLL
jgi:hypothetical protein